MKLRAAIIVFFILFGAECRAEETIYYYLELGDEPNQKAAAAKWEKLSQAHKNILGKLEFHPTIILRADRTIIVRVHAGPVDGKPAAQKKCLQLFALGVPCFVLEGGRHPYSKGETADFSALPWSQESLLPWFGRGHGAAEVEVAEAIRVPLKEEEQETVRPVFSKFPEPLPAVTLEMDLRESRETIRGWVDVRPFKNEDEAIAFWQSVRRLVPEQAAGLRVRVTRPLAEHDTADTALNIGPFAGEQDGLEFCRAGISPVSNSVLCRFTQAEPGLAAPLLSGSYTQGGNAGANLEPPSAAPPPMTGAWVQVISASTQPGAEEDWEKLRTEQSDLLGGLQSVTEEVDGSYAVRVGPFGTNADAISLCIRLQQRGGRCRVFNK